MALQQEATFNNGVTVFYWIIAYLTFDKINGTTKVVLLPYISRQIRLNGLGNYINDNEKNYTFDGYVSISDAYNLIKLSLNYDSLFSNATDI